MREGRVKPDPVENRIDADGSVTFAGWWDREPASGCRLTGRNRSRQPDVGLETRFGSTDVDDRLRSLPGEANGRGSQGRREDVGGMVGRARERQTLVRQVLVVGDEHLLRERRDGQLQIKPAKRQKERDVRLGVRWK